MLSSIVSFLPSLHLSSSNSILPQSPHPVEYNPTDNAEEEEAYKQQQTVEDDSSAKKDKSKTVHETFIVVRPPPAKSNHPLNLQVQLVPPAGRNPRQSLDDSDGANPNTPISLKRTPSNRSDTSSYGSTASIASTTSTASTRRVIIPLYNLQAHNVLTNTIVDAGTDAKIAKFSKRGIELIDLAVLEPVEVWSDRARAGAAPRNSRPPTPDPSGHTATTTAESSVISLPHVNPHANPNGTQSPNATPHPPSAAGPLGLPVASSKRNIFDKMFKKKNSPSTIVSPPTSPATRYSPSSSPLRGTKTLTPDPAATPTPRSKGHTRNLSANLSPSTIAGKLRNRSTSPNPLGLGLLQVPSLDDPAFNQGPGQGTSANGTGTETGGTPVTAVFAPSPNVASEDQKILRPPVLGIQPTLSFSYVQGGTGPAPEPIHLGNLSKSARALMYVWFVRKWYKRRADDSESGGLMGIVHSRGSSGFGQSGNGGPAAGEGVEVRFEWKRSSTKVKGKKGAERGRRGRGEGASLGKKNDSKDQLRDPERGVGREQIANRLSVISHQSASTNLSVSEDGHRDRSGTPTRDRERERRGSFGGSKEDDDGDDSDPEDSETPWICTLKIRRSGAGTTSSTFTTRSRQATSHGHEPTEGGAGEGNGEEEMGVLPSQSGSPQVLRVKVGTLSPTPHHPKVVAMLKVSFPLPDIEVERLGVVKRPLGQPGARPPLSQWPGLTLTAEEIKDVVCSTAMWVVVREGFGGIGKVSRKGDGWRIRA